MIRAIRPSAMAQDDASLITGWNIAPNVAYTLSLSVSASAVVVLLANADNTALIGSGVGLVGTDQPVTITPVAGQTVGRVDADIAWHLLVTAAGTEGDRTIRIGPAVDLPDEIHPIYTAEDMAVARATAAINSGANYVDDVTATCPLGLGAGIGDIASVDVGGGALIGQVEIVTWTATPDGTGDVAVIRRHTAIAPAAYTPPATPPVVADDTAETDADTEATGNVLANDTGTLTVSAVNGLGANVGEAVTGTAGGEFVIDEDGSWTFDPAGDFDGLTGSDTATTSVSYHASNGGAEASATLAVTVSAAASAGDQYWDNVVLLLPMTGGNGSTTFTDVKGHTVARGVPLVVEEGDGPQEITSYGDCNITGTFQNTNVLTVAHASDLNIGSQDFCIDLSIRWNAPPSTVYFSPTIISKAAGGAAQEFRLFYYIGQLYFQVSNNGSTAIGVFQHTFAPTVGRWYYLRVSRASGVCRLYIDTNKVAQASNSTNIWASTNPVSLYRDGANAFKCDCSMSYVRMTIGAARETTDTIQIPVLPYPEA